MGTTRCAHVREPTWCAHAWEPTRPRHPSLLVRLREGKLVGKVARRWLVVFDDLELAAEVAAVRLQSGYGSCKSVWRRRARPHPLGMAESRQRFAVHVEGVGRA